MMKHGLVRLLLLIACVAHMGAWAQKITEDEAKKIWADAKSAARDGPAEVALKDQAKLALPKGYAFVPQPQASRVLNVMGNPGSDPRLLGLVFPQDGANWFMTVRFEDAGYVKDDDAKDWNADDLLKSYREGTEAGNKEREKMGVAGIEILGWAEKPAYDAGTHRLAWAMSSREIGAPANAPQGVNYNTYALGREGYFSMNLVTGLNDLAKDKPSAHLMLGALNFNDGKRYADFNASTDKVAEYGLAALVVGVAAKKLGLFAVIAVFFAKFFKIIAIAAVAFGGAILKWLGGRKAKQVQPQSSAAPPSPPTA